MQRALLAVVFRAGSATTGQSVNCTIQGPRACPFSPHGEQGHLFMLLEIFPRGNHSVGSLDRKVS